MVETKSSNSEILSYSQKRKGFHEKYLSICKVKLLQPLPEVKVKERNIHVLDFHADRVKANDWLAICDALRLDRTLKYVTIRLRKNDEFVLENVDTLKKSKSLTSIPVIYSKFLLTELVESLQNMLTNNKDLEILTLEGLPISERYMTTLAKGLFTNQSIKVLNLSRCNIGDEGCEVLCSNIKHLANIETLNLSHCNIGIKGANAVRDFIKYQKIHRFSEAWIRSLRYQDIEPTSFGGLRKLLLNNNPGIGDEGLKLLTDELCEDVFIKDIEMQNCGLTHVAANEILNCLNVNKTILTFDISNNCELPQHLYRQVMLRLGSSDNDSYDSEELLTQRKVTKVQLIDRLKYLEDQLESEIFRRKQAEQLNDELRDIIENQKQVAEMVSQEKFDVPEGFTIISNDELEKLMTFEKSSVTQKSAKNIAVRLRRKRHVPVRKTTSFIIENPLNKIRKSRSETALKKTKKSVKHKKHFIERNIGDTFENDLKEIMEEKQEDQNDADLMQMFVKITPTTSSNFINLNGTKSNFNLKGIFDKPSSRAPYNSEIDSD